MNAVIEQLKTEAGGKPYLGESTYDAFWRVAISSGQVQGNTHDPFTSLNEAAQWAWHAAGVAAVREVAA